MYVSFLQGFGDFLRVTILIYHKIFHMSNGHSFIKEIFIILYEVAVYSNLLA